MSAYTDEKPFSIDLVAAVLRQIPFTDKLYHLGWLNSEFFGTEEYDRVSYRCIFRYQGCEGGRILISYYMLTASQVFILDCLASQQFILRPEPGHRLRLAVC